MGNVLTPKTIGQTKGFFDEMDGQNREKSVFSYAGTNSVVSQSHEGLNVNRFASIVSKSSEMEFDETKMMIGECTVTMEIL